MENSSITVQISDVKTICDTIFQHVQKAHGDSIELDWDYYWEIPDSELYNPLKEPSQLNLGQLTHDFERLEQIANGQAPPIGYALVWLGALLRAVGQRVIA